MISPIKALMPSPIRHWLRRKRADLIALKHKAKYNKRSLVYGLNTKPRDQKIVVSFTTYPGRINQAMYVADAMLRQTMKPDIVLMVLSKKEYSSKDELPNEYRNLEIRGLQIVFMEENLKPHNKYFYAMKHFPDSIVVTVDDDIFYNEHLIETLFVSYTKFPHAINAVRVHGIKLENNRLLPYNAWEYECNQPGHPSMALFATGVGGVLYPPHLMHNDLLDQEKILKLCLNNDDIWLKVMQVLQNTTVVQVPSTVPLLTIAGSQETSLRSTNVLESENDRIIHNCLHEYQLAATQLVVGTETK